MKNRLTRLAGTPWRVRVSEPTDSRDKIAVPRSVLEDTVPITVLVEVTGGRSSTASAMRAARVQQELEEVGATAETIHLVGEHATLEARADRRQMEHAARHPFVRRISLS